MQLTWLYVICEVCKKQVLRSRESKRLRSKEKEERKEGRGKKEGRERVGGRKEKKQYREFLKWLSG